MRNLLLTSVLIFGLISCSGDSSDEAVKLAPITVEQGKEKLEENALNFLTEIDNYKNDNSLTEIIELADYLLEEKTEGKSVVSKTLKNVSDLESGKSDLPTFNSKVLGDTLMDGYIDQTGVYQWNALNGSWDKIGESDDIIYKVAYYGKNAEFKVYNFESESFTIDGDEVPTSVNTILKIDSKEVYSQAYRASVDNGKYMPNSISNIIKVGNLTFSTTLNNKSNKELKFETSFSINNKELMNFNIAVNGNFTEIDNNAENLDKNIKALDILDSTEFNICILDAKVSGKATEPITIPEGDLSTDEVVSLLNDNISVTLSIGNDIIATGIFYSDETEEEYWDNNILVVKTKTEPNLKFLFSDNTTADFETFFNERFSSIEDKLTEVLDNYKALFD